MKLPTRSVLGGNFDAAFMVTHRALMCVCACDCVCVQPRIHNQAKTHILSTYIDLDLISSNFNPGHIFDQETLELTQPPEFHRMQDR